MKKIIFALGTGLCCFLISCNNKSADTGSSTGADSSASNSKASQMLQANRDLFKGIETGDSSKLNSISSDAVDHNGGPNGREIKGRDSIRHMLADMHNHVSDLKFDIISESVDTVNNYVMCLSKMTGTTKDNSMGAPANTKMDFNTVDVLKYKDGKFTDHWGYMDPKDIMNMMQASNPNSMKMEKKK